MKEIQRHYPMAIPRETPVLIVGGGPSGLILALQLARHGIRCTLVERNQSTTKWPKMDITNCRSMELFNRLGIAQGLREIGVPQKYSLDVLFSTGLSNGGELITKWGLPSPDEWRERIRSQNDGTMPREPYQRCSQSVFEAWLKPYIQAEPLIDSQFSVKFETLRELEDSVESYLTNVETGERYVTRSKFVVGCDGAGSSVRKAIGSELIGGPVPGAMLLVHFKSRDLNKLHRQGQFWHIYFTGGGVIISQDEVDTWTAHLPIPLDADPEEIDPDQAIYDVLGGSIGSCPIKIDKILIKSAWRPNICIATKYVSESRRIFLSGDAAHQNIPTGGYGMNTAVGDSFDIGWKLAAVLKGFCGKYILDSYEAERKPVALRNLDRSGVHFSVHTTYWNWALEAGPGVVASSADKGQQLRMKIRNHVLALDGENKDHGIEMGYRYNESPIIVPDDEETEPEWRVREYVTSTWPGVRAPHVYLADGKTSIFDLFGGDYTIVDFTEEGFISQDFMSSAATLNIPITRVHLPSEIHVRDVWGRRAVLIRPDDHVAWRAPLNPIAPIDVTRVLKVACGQLSSRDDISQSHVLKVAPEEGFSGTIGNQDQNTVQMLAAFQK